MDWLAGLLAAACVLPISGLFTVVADDNCNHMQARVEVAEPDTPRGAWCDALLWDYHWHILLLVPAAATLLLVLLVGRRPRAYVPAWGCGALLAFAAIQGLIDARSYPLI